MEPAGLKEGKCKKCHAPLYWIQTPKKKWMPVDRKKRMVIDDDGTTHFGYDPHWATCPNAEDFKKGG